MKLGVITDGISRDLDHALRVMTEAGLEYAEFQFLWDKEVGELDKDETRRALQLVKQYGAKVSCLSRQIFFGLPMATSKPGDEVHKQHMAGFHRCIQMAHEFECPIVRVMSGRKEPILFGHNGADHWLVSKGAWAALAPLIEPAVRIAEREGILVVVETVFSGMAFSAWAARKLVDEIGSKHFKVLWDPANALYCHERAWPEGYEWIRDGYIGHVHIKDADMDTTQGTVTFRQLGHGLLADQLEPMAKSLRNEHYEGVISYESVYRPTNGTFEDGFRASVGRFKELFG